MARRNRVGAIEIHRVAAVAGIADPVDDVARDRLGVLAARIVAGDDHAVGEPRRRRAPISGRLPRSRSPPQPNTHTELAARPTQARSARQHLASASGVWA